MAPRQRKHEIMNFHGRRKSDIKKEFGDIFTPRIQLEPPLKKVKQLSLI